MSQKIRGPLGLSLLGIIAIAGTLPVEAQTPAYTAQPYPDPTASAGMTSGLPNGVTAQQMEMMRVRTEAQSAQGQAAAASMARSVDNTLEAQTRERTLQSAREIKAIKRSMAERLKWERANSTQVNKVTSDEMSAWNTSSGNVRVERDVPDPFLRALIEEERIAMENGTLEKPKKGFKPLQSTAAALSSPFQRFSNDDPGSVQTAATNLSAGIEEEKGFLKNLKIPRIGGRSDSSELVSPGNAEPTFISTPVGASPQAEPVVASAVPSATTVPQISGAERLNAATTSSPSVGESAPNPYAGGPQSSAPAIMASASSTPAEPERSGLFSRLKPNDNPVPESGGGSFFGFGRKKASSESGDPGIDASLFPEGAMAQAPTGDDLSGGYSASDVAQEAQSVPSSTGNFALPREEPEKKRFGFSFPSLPALPKPDLSIPSIGGGSSGPTVPTLTTINSAGNDFYVVTNTAQFMVYGDETAGSEIRALPAGTIVRMTKPGDQWASVQLPGGDSGIVQNQFLRGASSSEAGSQFASSN